MRERPRRPPGRRLRLLRRRLGRCVRDQAGATALEWTLLLAAIALPSYAVIRMGLDTLVAHYQMLATLNGLPFP